MNKLKKVTFLIGQLTGGGAEGVCVNLANEFKLRGIEVDLVTLGCDNSPLVSSLGSGVKLINLRSDSSIQAFLPLISYFRSTDSTAFLVFNYELSIICLLLRTILNKKISIVSRNINTISILFSHEKSMWRKLFVLPVIKMFYHRVDHVINQCESMKNDLENNFPKIAGKTSVIYNPISLKFNKYVSETDISNKCEPYILCIGRLEFQKAFHFAIQAFSKIKKNYPNLRLKIVGDGGLKQELANLSKLLRVDKYVDFCGFTTNVIPYYENAKLTILTSLFEGFPNVLVESIALGTPVVSFDCPSGPSEIIIEGVNGFIVENGNVEKLAVGIDRALNHVFLKKDVIESSSRFKSERILPQYFEVLERVHIK